MSSMLQLLLRFRVLDRNLPLLMTLASWLTINELKVAATLQTRFVVAAASNHEVNLGQRMHPRALSSPADRLVSRATTARHLAAVPLAGATDPEASQTLELCSRREVRSWLKLSPGGAS